MASLTRKNSDGTATPISGVSPDSTVVAQNVADIAALKTGKVDIAGRRVNAATALVNTDGTIEFYGTTAIDQFLPAVAGITAWKPFEFINAGTANVTIKTPTTGVTDRVIPPGGAVTVKHNGTSWLAS